jgi:hypothetical protein
MKAIQSRLSLHHNKVGIVRLAQTIVAHLWKVAQLMDYL